MGIALLLAMIYFDRMKKTSQSRAFTLIELLVVIAIIAVLTGIIMVDLNSSRAKARDAQRVSGIGQIQLALEFYYDRCKSYPTTLDTGTATNCMTSTGTVTLGTYIAQIPQPSSAGTGVSAYDYAVNSSKTDYVLHTALEYPISAYADSLGTFPTDASWTAPSWASACNGSNTATSKDYCAGPKI